MPIGGEPDEPGLQLAALRIAAGLTQEELADRAQLSVRSLRNLEHGLVARPRRTSLNSLAKALNLTATATGLFVAQYRGETVGGDGDRSPDAPAELPAGPVVLVGRDVELARLDALAANPGPSGAIIVIDGLGGVGKTTLATHWARIRADHYPDGAHYIDLHGYGTLEPVTVMDALARLLHGVGVPDERLPAELDARSALWRSVAAGRRFVLVLDNARGVDQVRALLPSTSSCITLITSRDRLDGLAVRENAARIALPPLDDISAQQLLCSRLGDRSADPLDVQRTVDFCAGLPLALGLLGVRAACDGLDQVAATLGDPAEGFDLLRASDDDSALDAVFSWSVDALPTDVRAVFVGLTQHPGETVDATTVAALLARPAAAIRDALQTLHHANLVTMRGPARYWMHDLVRRYAADLAMTELSDEERSAMRRRLLEHLHARAYLAAARVEPLDLHRISVRPAGIGEVADFADRDAALLWLERELPSTIAACAGSTEAAFAPTVVAIATTLWRCLIVSGHHVTGLVLHRLAVDAARRAGDRAGEGHANADLGAAMILTGDNAGADEALHLAWQIARETGDVQAQARAVGNLGIIHERAGRYDEALRYQRISLTLAVEVGDRAAQARAHNSVGVALALASRCDEARESFECALALAVAADDVTTEGRALINLGEILSGAGRHVEALARFEGALVLARSSGHRSVEGDVHCAMGQSCVATGRADDAESHFDAALRLADAHHLPTLRVDVSNGLGALAQLRGADRAATQHFSTAANDAEKLDYAAGRSAARDGIDSCSA